MRNVRKALALVASLAVHSLGCASPQRIACPQQISADSVKIAPLPGWRTYAPYALPLYGAGMSAGPPESETQLRGEPLDKAGLTVVYEFGRAGMEGGRWLDCLYGRAGEFLMSMRLDDRVRQCMISHGRLVVGEVRQVSIDCRQ
jgi:hypothetical protein